MSEETQDPTVARVKDLEQALLATKHLLAKAQADRSELRTAIDLALVEHASLEAARAELARELEQRTREVGALAQANTGIGVALLDTQLERDDATAELVRTRSDLVRVTEERNSARESHRAQTFELQLLRDEPAEKRLAVVTAERTKLLDALEKSAKRIDELLVRGGGPGWSEAVRLVTPELRWWSEAARAAVAGVTQ